MKRIVSAVEDGVPQAEAARLFGVARWSVARYVRLTREGKPLSSKQSGSVKPTKVREEAKRALRTDLEVFAPSLHSSSDARCFTAPWV